MSAATALAAASEGELRLGALHIDRARRRATLAGAELYLSEREYRLLVALATEPQRTLTYEELVEAEVLADTPRVSRRLIDAAAARLRRKLELRGAGELIAPRRGIGFQFSADAEAERSAR